MPKVVCANMRRFFLFRRAWLLLPSDVLALIISMAVSFELRFNWNIPYEYHRAFILFISLQVFVSISFFVLFRLYTRVWKYASIRDMQTIILANAYSAVVIKSIDMLVPNVDLPWSVWLSGFLLSLTFVGSNRFLVRIWHQRRSRDSQTKSVGIQTRLLIYGAGSAGSLITKEINKDSTKNWEVVGFIDDDPAKRGLVLNGIRILGCKCDLKKIISEINIEQIIVAIPSLDRHHLSEIVEYLNHFKLPILIVPPYTRWMVDNLFSQIRPVDVEDLLGRDPLPVNVKAVGQYLRDTTVLVTGAGGSIGSEICRQIVALGPQKIILLGRGENSIFEINQEIKANFPGLNSSFVIGDVRDKKKLEHVFKTYYPDVVFHAAAHKHVPLMEAHPDEAYVNNVIATRNLAELSSEFGVSRFVLISSDKAVRPTNIMGASKRIAEMVIQAIVHSGTPTRFVIVRFGNVLGSRGSVVRIFRQQIAKGGPITVTDERMMRYFMTIPEAVRLVIEAGATGESGQIYLLDMGEPVRILDLAERMIRLSGFEPGDDIPIHITGSRPGEKLFEELSRESDSISLDENGRICTVRCPVMPQDEFWNIMESLHQLYIQDKYDSLGKAIKEFAWWEPQGGERDFSRLKQPVAIAHEVPIQL